MLEQSAQKYPHIMPDDCKPLMSEEGYAALAQANIAIDIQQSVDYMRTYQFPFAAVYDQIPVLDERENYRGMGGYTCIKDDEFGATDDETAHNTLTRMGCKLADTQYWLVYLTELDAPNEDGATKIFTLNSGGLPAGKTHFVGFGWKPKATVEAESLQDLNQESELIRELNGIMYWLNDMIVGVTLRDADDGMYLIYYEAIKRKGAIDKRAIKFGKKYADSIRNSKNYPQLKAEFQSKTHVIPDKYQHLVSEQSKVILAEQGLFIKVSDLPKNCHLTFNTKVFGIEGYYPSVQWVKEHGNSACDYAVIAEEDCESTIKKTAEKLMLSMGGDLTTMSYCPIYKYDSDEANKWDHTKIYTVNINDFSAEKGSFAGLAIAYNHDIKPFQDDEPKQTTAARRTHEVNLEAMSGGQKVVLLKNWRDTLRERVRNSLFEIEAWANGTLVDVAFHRADNGDLLYGYDRSPYKNTDVAAFNNQLQTVIQKKVDDVNDREANTRAILKTSDAV